MRKLYFLTGLLLALQPTFGQLLTEPFSYTPHATIGLGTQSGGTWIPINSGDEVIVQSGSLSYGGLAASSGNSITYGGAGLEYYRTFTNQTSGTVYYSLLLNISTLGTLNTTGGYFLGFIDGTTNNFSARLWARLSGTSNFNIGINSGSGVGNTTWAAPALAPGTTYLVVVSYQFNAGASNDVAKVWINPVIGGSEPSQDALSTNTGVTDASSIQRFFVRQDAVTTTAGSLTVDELRVGTTWSSVTPEPIACSGAPSLQAGFGTITPTDITASINLTTGTGGVGRVLKINILNVFVDMVDGSDPVANTAYAGGEQVILNGTGTGPINVTGLSPSTTYYLGVYEYNCVVGRFYLNPGATTNFTTNAPIPFGLQVASTNTAYVIDFDNTVAGVNNGQLNITSNTWGTSSPLAGQVNSNAFAFNTTSSTAISTFGGTLLNGNTATTAGQTIFGVYAFEVSPGNRALGMQPTGTGWAAGGNYTLRIQNQTGATLTSLFVVYKVYVFNNEARSTSIGFSSSSDNTASSYVASATYNASTPLLADGPPAWKVYLRQVFLTGLTVPNLGYYYLRVTGVDNGGAGSRDEFAFDDITIVANPSVFTPTFTGNLFDVVIAGGANLSGATTIEADLTLTSGDLNLGDNDLSVGGFVSGSASAYVRTNGTGSLILSNIGVLPRLFPIGNSTYNPITIANGSGFNWSARVEDALNNVVSTSNTYKAINRTWHISPSGTVVTGPDVTFNFNDADDNQLANPAAYHGDPIRDAQFWHYSGAEWQAASGAVAMTPSEGPQSPTLSGYTNYSPFAIAKISGPLPVKFSNIRAYEQGSGIRVDWSNLTEIDVVNYELERSANGIDFTKISTVTAVRNDGSRADYSWFDATPIQGVSFYRVRSLETSGHRLYSAIVRVSTKGGINEITIYPNPVSGNQVSFQATLPRGDYRLELLNAGGQKVYSLSLQHDGGTITEALQWPFTMKPGLYNFIISNGEFRISKSFIIR